MSSKSYGPEYDFPGMKLSFINKKVKVDMREHSNKAMNDFGEEINDTATPARNHLKKEILNRHQQMKMDERSVTLT